MNDYVLDLNADIHRRSITLLQTADDTWSDIQHQTVKIIQEAAERLPDLVATAPTSDPDHWLHDLRSPGASMLSAVSLLRDEAEITPSHLDLAAVAALHDVILELRAAIEDLANEKQGS
jgi:DNA-binding NarL/FixJ family response regulator